MFGLLAAQFAYMKQQGARDAVALYVLSWICALNSGYKIGVYCSDASGAFNRVDADSLMQKLSSLKLNRKLMSVIRSWLRDRQGYVIVSSQKSSPVALRTMVWTVWGPALWNA